MFLCMLFLWDGKRPLEHFRCSLLPWHLTIHKFHFINESMLKKTDFLPPCLYYKTSLGPHHSRRSSLKASWLCQMYLLTHPNNLFWWLSANVVNRIKEIIKVILVCIVSIAVKKHFSWQLSLHIRGKDGWSWGWISCLKSQTDS